MNKSILILDENSVIHGLIASALDLDGLTLHHEFNPEHYVERAQELQPDLILLSNSDQRNDYSVARALKASPAAPPPVVLLAGANDEVADGTLDELDVQGLIRKPFEASDLQQQVSKHLNLIDLIGSAYEYRKSQSLGDEGVNPLANLDVLDTEVLSMLRDNGESARGVPEVDFGAELAAESTAPRETESAAAAAGAPQEAASPNATLEMDEATFAETLHPEQAFEMLGEIPEPAEHEHVEALHDEAMPLHGEDFDESALHAEAEQPVEEEEVEELSAADLLEEESEEETVAAPSGFDQPLAAEEAEADRDVDRAVQLIRRGGFR